MHRSNFRLKSWMKDRGQAIRPDRFLAAARQTVATSRRTISAKVLA